MGIPTPTTLERDYAAITGGAGLLDRSARGKIDVLGEEALDYLQGQVTNEIESREPGQGCYAAILNPKGHVLADLRMYRIGRRVEIADRTSERALLSLIGPAWGDVARSALETPGEALPVEEHRFLEA